MKKHNSSQAIMHHDVRSTLYEHEYTAAHHEGALIAALPDQPELQDLGLRLAGLSSLAFRHQQLLGFVPPQLATPSLHCKVIATVILMLFSSLL